jgi:hypothetical protein
MSSFYHADDIVAKVVDEAGFQGADLKRQTPIAPPLAAFLRQVGERNWRHAGALPEPG